MTKPITKDEANRILYTEGWFHGLNTLIREYEFDTPKTAKVKAGLFNLMLAKIQEAKAEVARLQNVVTQLEATCRVGTTPRPSDGNDAYGPNVARLRDQVRALDGWTISLLESSISILAATETPETAGKRVNDLKTSFAHLWALRTDGFKAMKRFPEQFDVTTLVIR